MKKEDFRMALRDKLGKVSLETRQTWSDTDLYAWWLKAQVDNSYLRWERASGDLWQHVRGICQDLIGPDAMW